MYCYFPTGLSEISVDDWRLHTTITGYRASDPIISWFWDVVAAMSSADRAQLLHFVTGLSRLPPGGFARVTGLHNSPPFTIAAGGAPDSLCSASTCFNRLKLPPYRSRAELQDKLFICLRYGAAGFSFS